MANAITVGTLTLTSTLTCISVKAAFTNDDNSNATATLQYRVTGSSTWIDAYVPIVDRNANITTFSGTVANAFVNQARGSVVGLTQNTSYDIQLTWSDPDGVTGTNPVTGTISTKPNTPPLPGSIEANGPPTGVHPAVGAGGAGTYADPYNSIATAITNTSAGDTIGLKAGSYPATTLSTSGTSSAFRRLLRDPLASATGVSFAAGGVTVNANFWVIDGLYFATTTASVFTIGTQNNIYIQNCQADNYNTGGAFGESFVNLGNANNIFIRNNTAVRTSALTHQEGGGVYMTSSSAHTVVIDGNSFTGNMWDGIGNEFNDSGTAGLENCDFCNNTINGYEDDSMEVEGAAVNTRCWGNTVISTNGQSVLGLAGPHVGPAYVFRNILTMTSGASSGVKGGNFGTGYCFFFHNTVETVGAGGNEAIGGAGGTNYTDKHVYKNNILKSSGNSLDHGGDEGARNNTYDYNCYFRTGGANFSSDFLHGGVGNAYTNLSDFVAATPQEDHGIQSNPSLDSSKHISSTSPAYNAGVVLANFNTRDSVWGYTDTAPDMGMWEVGGFTSNATENRFRTFFRTR